MEILYNGAKFRTILEARWAVFYDALQISFRYEREKMHPDGVFYPSHFWLPEQHMWVTIKGSIEDSETIDRSRFETEAGILSSHMKGEDVYTFYGQIPVVENSVSLDYEDADNDSAHRVFIHPDSTEENDMGGFDHYYHWCECPECGSLDVQYGGRAARNKCGCLPGDRGHNPGSLRLNSAYELAKEAQVVVGELLTTFAGIVYLIKSGPNYKIGRTTNLKQRIGNIKLQLPDPVETIHIIKTNDEVKLESYWHKRFAGKRKNGEWFSLSDEDVAEFKSKSLMPVNTTLL